MVDPDPLLGLSGPPETSPTLAEQDARSARQRVEALAQEVLDLRGQVALLHALTRDLWRAARPHLASLSDDVHGIESRLEAYEAWVAKQPAPCPGCERPLAARSPRCVFCGHRRG